MFINKNDITIMSYEKYCDYIGADENVCWYDGIIVQYCIGTDFVSFAFCETEPYNINEIKNEISEQLSTKEYPSWTQLSQILKNEIIKSDFDMNFIELDDEKWSVEKAEKILDEVSKLGGLNDCITIGESDSYLTFYAGSMCTINWNKHKDFGTTYFSKNIKSLESIFEEYGFIIDVDEYLNQIDIYNKSDSTSICSLFIYTSEQYDSSFNELDEIILCINSIESHYMKNLITKDNSIERR